MENRPQTPWVEKVTLVTRPRPTPEQYMTPRWQQDATTWPDAQAPQDPRAWEQFIQDYYGDRAVWTILALDDATHSMRPDRLPELRQGFEWTEVTRDYASFCVHQFGSPPTPLPKTRIMRVLSPGILLVGNGEGDWVRIDGHLTTEDEQWVHQMDHWDNGE